MRVEGEPVKSVRGRISRPALPAFGVSVLVCRICHFSLLFVLTVASIYGGQAGHIILQNLQWEFIIISPPSLSNCL